jgi:hypothetical protein
MNLVWVPLHQAPSAPCMNFFSRPSNIFLGSEWILMEEQGANDGMLRKFSQKATISWERRGSEIR